jgi:hypothetical protein
MPINQKQSWSKSETKVFWGEIAPCEHVVQIYDDNEVFLDTLARYVGDGINSGDGIILIARTAHLEALKSRLQAHAINVESLIAQHQYIALDAEETLSKFMVNGWPDEDKFITVITEVLRKAKSRNKRIRAFGEMVAILWEQGHYGATVNLEHLWNSFLEKETLSLFCAYPRSGFTQNAGESMVHICSHHSIMIDGNKSSAEILYQMVD